MNLIEAIKSGKPFRCKTWSNRDYWLGPSRLGPSMTVISQLRATTDEELAGDDWEIQEPTVTITRTQLQDAYNDARNSVGDCSNFGASTFIVMAKKLGLGLEDK